MSTKTTSAARVGNFFPGNGGMTVEVAALKSALPLPALLHKLGMGEFAKACVRSPFREDKNPSWGIFQRDGRWGFKDQATGECGDEITFLAHLRGLHPRLDFPKVLDAYKELVGVVGQPAHRSASPNRPAGNEESKPLPDKSGFGVGTKDQLRRLSALRGIGLPGLELATERGVLVFRKDWHGHEVFGVTDRSDRVLELRRLDGKLFPAVGILQERKSHAIRGSQKAWPVGIIEATNHARIALVEGIPDFLEAHYLTLWESASVRVAPVAILSASVRIAEEALPFFRGKRVRIFPHNEKAGLLAADRWQRQLIVAGAAHVDLFSLAGLKKGDGSPVKDLMDLESLSPRQTTPELLSILP